MLALTEAATAALLLVKEYLRVELDDPIGCDLRKGWVVAPFVPWPWDIIHTAGGLGGRVLRIEVSRSEYGGTRKQMKIAYTLPVNLGSSGMILA